ncbi:hypothetical protein Fot_19693 [Forsythia ovata]|uniref:Uncharacterized protein n=1 Tax=Forsythia ovata TaxID=205694 RepID=A0ABD1VLR7_9LAMI
MDRAKTVIADKPTGHSDHFPPLSKTVIESKKEDKLKSIQLENERLMWDDDTWTRPLDAGLLEPSILRTKGCIQVEILSSQLWQQKARQRGSVVHGQLLNSQAKDIYAYTCKQRKQGNEGV